MGKLTDRRTQWLPNESDFVSTGKGRPGKRPNIVFILADDLGWGDVGAYGSLHNNTPAIDRIAAGGLRFTHGYSGSATCSPTRISLYTGRYPGRIPAGLQEPIVSRDERTGIPHEHPTLPSLLKDGGYRTAMFGKWHAGFLPWFSPIRIGFEEFFGNLDGAVDYFSHIDTSGQPDLYEGETPVEEIGYYTHLISERATKYIEEYDSDQPFYLQVNYTTPHWPWEGPEDEATSVRVTAAMKENPLTALFHFEGGSLETYQTMVAAMDEGIDRVLGALAAKGLSDDTIVVFTSDNGGERYAFLWPFVGEKGDLEEGGIRVPLIIRWPGAIPGGRVTDVPVVTMDLTASLLDAAGVAPHADHPLDGQTLLPWLLERDPAPARVLRWRTREQGAIRKGRFKLLFDRQAKPLWGSMPVDEGPRVRLFDVTAEGREKADLSGDFPQIAAELLDEWLRFDQELLPYPSRHPITEPQAVGRAD